VGKEQTTDKKSDFTPKGTNNPNGGENLQGGKGDKLKGRTRQAGEGGGRSFWCNDKVEMGMLGKIWQRFKELQDISGITNTLEEGIIGEG